MLASIFSSLWGIALINRGTLGWFSAYGHVLATCFLLLILVDIAKLAREKKSPGTEMLLRWSVLLIVAAFSWGVGIGIALSFFLSAWFLLFHLKQRLKVSLILLVPAMVVIVIYALIQTIVLQNANDSFVLEFPYDNLFFWTSSIKLFLAKMSYSASTIIAGQFIINSDHELIISYCITCIFIVIVIYLLIKSSEYHRNLIVGIMVLLITICGLFSFSKAWISELLKLSFRSVVVSPWHYYLTTLLVALMLSIACSHFIESEKIKSKIIPISLMLLYFAVLFGVSSVPAAFFYDMHGVKCRNEYSAIVDEVEASTAPVKHHENIYIHNEMTKNIRIPFQTEKNFDFPGLAAVYLIARFEGKFSNQNILFIEDNPDLAQKLLKDKNTAISKIVVPKKTDTPYKVVDISY